MTKIGDLVRRVQQRLVVVSWVRAVLVGLIVGLGLWLLMRVLLAFALGGAGDGPVVAVVVAAFVAGIGTMWRVRTTAGDITRARAALWLEERFPSLQFALVTLTEFDDNRTRVLSEDAHERLRTAVGNPDIRQPLARITVSQLRVPVVLALILVAATAPLNAYLSRGDALADAPLTTGARATSDEDTPANRALASWQVRVIPPPYSGLPTRDLPDANQVTALVGSRVEIVGAGATAPVAELYSTVDSITPRPLALVSEGQRWRTQFTMPSAPADARFTLGTAHRQLLLEPRADSIPVVHLQQPTRDSVFREAKGTVTLNASAHDDLGLSTANFELIVTSGEGERFTAKTIVIGVQRLNGRREHQWQSSFSMDTMQLVAGDILHMRAVARDRHPDAAHELGASETRTFRIARPSEYDSIAVESGPPPEVQKSLMSQRMLLILTEKLVARAKTITHETLVRESRKLAADQVQLRKAVGNLVFQRLEGEDSGEHSHSAGDGHDHGVNIEQGKMVQVGSPLTDGEEGDSPIVAINKPLLEAFNAMWDAASALEIAEPKAAVPHMKLALAAIERARSAERIYLRGKPPVAIVDIAKIRLVGKDTGVVNTRGARDAISPREAQRETRLLAAALLLTRHANAGRDSLALLRLESLTDAPRLAAALNDVLEVVRRGGDATAALIRARRMIGIVARSDSLSTWRGI